MLRGLPGCGKTTWAREFMDFVKKGGIKETWKRVNKDDLRAMINNSFYSKNEKDVLQWRDNMVMAWLANGYNVIVDDTNFAPHHEINLRDLAKRFDAEFEVKFFDVPIQVCHERNAKRQKPVPAKVINEMYCKYVKKAPKYQWTEYVAYDERDNAIIVDIDGTLAHMEGRSPYDYSRVLQDKPDECIINLVNMIDSVPGWHVIIMSGRPESCRTETIQWLSHYSSPVTELHMRPVEMLNEHDEVVKEWLYNTRIKQHFKVLMAIDDRDRVVDMWRRIGVKCLQAERGNF
jgi:tRNA uridine 5-carbamoylmethylation protein Kti12